MATKIREYKIRMPYSASEWRKAQRYILAKYMTDEVKIIKHVKTKSENSVETESHKFINLEKRLPAIMAKLLNGNALLVDEYSKNLDYIIPKVEIEEDMKCDGLIKNVNKREIKDLKKNIDEKDVLNAIKDINLKPDVKDVNVTLNEPISLSESRYVSKRYDEKTFKLMVRTKIFETSSILNNVFDLEPGFKSREIDMVPKGHEGATIWVYKLVEVQINSILLSWTAESIKNLLRDMLLQFQEKIIETEEEWKAISVEDLEKLEVETIDKFMNK